MILKTISPNLLKNIFHIFQVAELFKKNALKDGKVNISNISDKMSVCSTSAGRLNLFNELQENIV